MGFVLSAFIRQSVVKRFFCCMDMAEAWGASQFLSGYRAVESLYVYSPFINTLL
jgi:hypothetical protein